MRLRRESPARAFRTGARSDVVMLDVGRVDLDPDEQVTFTTGDGGEYDVARKEWGFYATPSLNGRLARFGLRPVVVKNRAGRYFVLLVERGHEGAFDDYVESESLTVVAWLDSDEALEAAFGA